MNWYEKNKLLWRLLILYFIVLLIKGFDRSYGPLNDITLRGQVFTLFFLAVWMSTWYFSIYINVRIKNFNPIFHWIINGLIGVGAGFITNAGYRYGDSRFFDNSDLWSNIPYFNPELTLGIAGIYLLIYMVHIYIQSIVRIKEEQIRSEQLAKENILARYKSLKAQIEPHFLFNSLSVLSSIMHTDINLASAYVLKLSRTLRYIIEKNEFTLVPLKEEMEVVNDYYFLLQTRFGDRVQLRTELQEKHYDEIYIPPATLQLLMENAVKHNKQSETAPLTIRIRVADNYLEIENTLNKRADQEPSLSVGLRNIEQRYALIADGEVMIEESETHFRVKLPLLYKKHYESFTNRG